MSEHNQMSEAEAVYRTWQTLMLTGLAFLVTAAVSCTVVDVNDAHTPRVCKEVCMATGVEFATAEECRCR